METQHVCRFFRRHLVVADILDVLDVQAHGHVHALRDCAFDQIRNLAHRVVPGSYVEDPGNLVVGFDGADVCGCRVVDAKQGAPDGRIVYRDDPVFHGRLEHRVDDQV